jgi:hypothetical protein
MFKHGKTSICAGKDFRFGANPFKMVGFLKSWHNVKMALYQF